MSGVGVEIDTTIAGRGEFDVATGRVRVNPDRHSSAEDMAVSVCHEVVGHGGMEAIVGKNSMDWLDNEVWRGMSAEERAGVRKRHGDISFLAPDPLLHMPMDGSLRASQS